MNMNISVRQKSTNYSKNGFKVDNKERKTQKQKGYIENTQHLHTLPFKIQIHCEKNIFLSIF